MTKREILQKIANELDLIRPWVSGEYPDYPEKEYKYITHFQSFFHPERVVFEFDTPVINEIISGKNENGLSNDLIRVLIILQQTISNLQQYGKRLNTFTLSFPELYLKITNQIVKDKSKVVFDHYSDNEKAFMDIIFHMNYCLHHRLIGGDWNQDGLYVAHRNAVEVLTEITRKENARVSEARKSFESNVDSKRKNQRRYIFFPLT